MSVVVPTGVSDFRKLRDAGAYYVDKTAFIGGVLGSGAEAMLFLRPRRFGKTTNLSALRWFVERNEQDLSALFEGLTVWDDPAARAHFQRHPVISLTFKDAKVRSAAELEERLIRIIANEFERHAELESSPKLSERARADYKVLASGRASASQAEQALLDLSRWLQQHHGEPVVILVDEYDVPIHGGLLHGYADWVLEFFRNFLSAGFKDNPHLFKGVLTGVLRVAKESLFSGLNNLAVFGVTRPEFGSDFGFTSREVGALFEEIGASDLLGQIADWYDGYLVGSEHIYNPWSILSFVDSVDRVFRPHWRATGSEDLLRELLLTRGLGLRDEMAALFAGDSVEVAIEESVSVRDLGQRPDALWTFLLYAGYLTSESTTHEMDGTIRARVRIPNREVRGTYSSLFADWLGESAGGDGEVQDLIRALLAGDAAVFERHLAALVRGVLSYHDASGREAERVYHAFLLGILARLEGRFDIRSNRETGLGRADVLILPRRPGEPGVVLEIKRIRPGESMEAALEGALAQIHAKDYAAELRSRGASRISAFAVVFEGKSVAVRAG